MIALIKEKHLIWYVAGITLTGLVVRLYHLGYPSLWLDEIGQVVAARMPLKQLLSVVSTHLSPPLDYLLLKPFLFLGRSDWVARLPAFVYGAAAVPVMYLWSRRIMPAAGALLAALMLALSPMAVAFSQEARMYSLFLLLSLISYSLVTVFLENASMKTAICLGLVNGALVLTHYFGFVAMGIELVLLGAVGWRKSWRAKWFQVGVAFLIPAAIFVPWYPVFIKQIENSGGQIGYALLADKDFIKYILNAFSIHTGGEEGPWYYIYIMIFIAGAVLAIIDKKINTIILAVGFITIVAISFIFTSIKPIVTTRNLIFLLPVYLLVGAYAVNRLREAIRLHAWVAAVLTLVLLIPPVYHYHTAGRPDFKPDWKRAAGFLKNNVGADEIIAIPDKYSRGCMAYYLEPAADYVFMKPGWTNEENDAANKIWLAKPAIEELHPASWLVLPPQSFQGLDRNEYKRLVENITPAASYKTQGKGNPLEVYRLH